jgi:hypothetical protein
VPPVPTNVSPGDVQVKVLNGSGRAGQAGSVSSSLRQSGFVVTGTGNADSARYITSVVRYGPNQENKARYLQSLVIGGAQLIPDPTVIGTNLVLVTGSAYSGLRPANSSAVSTSTTAAPGVAAAPPTTVSPLPGATPGQPEPVCNP